MWFVKVLDKIQTTEDKIDEYGHKTIKGQIYLKGHNLENKGYYKKKIKNKLMTKTLYFFKENIMYSFKNFEIHYCTYLITDNEYIRSRIPHIL